jgi:hypothetical protein
MFFWFERAGAYARYEVLQLPNGGFELRVVEADGTEHVEGFKSADEVARRQRSLEATLRENGWSGPHGWVL